MTRTALRRQAALLSYFETGWLEGGDADDVPEFLLEDCERVTDADGKRRWSLRESVRRSIVSQTPADALRSTLRSLSERPADTLQWAIDTLVAEDVAWDVAALDGQHLRALESASRWLTVDGRSRHHVLRGAVRRRALIESLSSIAGDRFVGRRTLLAQLAEDVGHTKPPVVIHGMGGVGKSAVVARHLLDAADAGALIAYLNFDHGALDATRPASMLRAIAAQLAFQVDAEKTDAHAVLERIAGDRDSTQQLAVPTRGMQVHEHEILRPLLAIADQLVGQRLVIALDTVEEAQRHQGATIGLWRFVTDLLRALPRAQVVLAGRAPLPELNGVEIRLDGLERPEAVELLHHLLGPETPIDPEMIIDLVGTSPLALRLACGVLQHAPADVALRNLTVSRAGMEGELYRRLLGHIDDPAVRRIAHPGLTVRRVTPEVIRRVLAGPCGVRVPSDERARELFDGLASEAMLVEPSPTDPLVLVHRTDVRRTMLRRLAADEPEVVARVHRAAVRYYTRSNDPDDRTEAMYHRLMLGQAPTTLDARWSDEFLPGLLASVDELPPASKSFLKARAPDLEVSSEDLHHATLEGARELVRHNVQSLIAEGSVSAALSVIDNHMVVHEDRAPEIMDLLLQALELAGRLDEALEVAERERRRAGDAGAADDLFLFTMHAARLLERVGDSERADAHLAAAADAARSFEPTGRMRLTTLRLLVARLGLRRRAGQPLDEGTAQEALALYDDLPHRTVLNIPGLLRDIAIELGGRSPEVIRTALSWVGVDISGGQVRDLLLQVDGLPEEHLDGLFEPVERKRGGGLVIDLLNRMDAGSSRRLVDAVREDYANEAHLAVSLSESTLVAEDRSRSFLAMQEVRELFDRLEHDIGDLPGLPWEQVRSLAEDPVVQEHLLDLLHRGQTDMAGLEGRLIDRLDTDGGDTAGSDVVGAVLAAIIRNVPHATHAGPDEEPPPASALRPPFLPLPADIADGQGPPSLPLRAEYGVVPFRGREEELAWLEQWCGDDAPLAVAALIAAPGSGKSRLAAESAERARQTRDWMSGFLMSTVDQGAFDELARTPVPLLVVIDDAPARGSEIARLLVALDRSKRRAPARVLLLARDDGEWRQNTLPYLLQGTGTPEIVLGSARTRRLASVEPATGGRVAAFDDAVLAFRTCIGATASHKTPRPDLSQPLFANILCIHLAALTSVAGEASVLRGRIAADTLLADLLQRETRYWSDVPRPPGGPLDDGTVRKRIIALATLTTAQDEVQAVDALLAIPDLADTSQLERHTIARWLRTLYPASEQWSDRPDASARPLAQWFRPVTPDLVGEFLVATVLADLPKLASDVLDQSSPEQAEHVLTVLTRSARNHVPARTALQIAIDRHIGTVWPAGLRVAQQTGDPLGQVLADTLQRSPDPQLASVIVDEIPVRTTALVEVAVVATAQALEHASALPPGPTQDAERVRHANNLANRLSAGGSADQALLAIDEAVTMSRMLAERHPQLRRSPLALTLNSKATLLATVDRNEEALEAVEEAIAILRPLAQDDPDTYISDSAYALVIRSNLLATLGRRIEALEAIEEARSIFRRLAEADPDAHLPELATALHNESNRLGALGENDRALQAIDEAFAIFQGLAEHDPDAYLPDLAMTLHNRSSRLAAVGRSDEALAVAIDAVTIVLPVLERHPFALPDAGARLGHNYLRRHADVSREPDPEIVARLDAVRKAAEAIRPPS